jgi:DNA primase
MSAPFLEDLLEEIGITLGRSTEDEVFGLCPGHKNQLGREDRKPTTWSVSRRTGGHYCFACEYGGSMVELIVELTKCSVWDALKLMRHYGIDPTDPEGMPDSYHERPSKTAKTKHLPEEALDQFDEVPAAQLEKRKLSAKSAKHYDVLWDSNIKCWILPVRLIGGALIGWQAKSARFFDNYPESMQKSSTLFGINRFESGEPAILVESPLDVVRLHTLGYDNAVAAMGTNVSDEQMRLLLSVTDEIVLALDNDDAGQRWMHRVITGHRGKRKQPGVAWGTKFKTYVFNYRKTDGKDPGEMSADEIEWGFEHAVAATDWAYE